MLADLTVPDAMTQAFTQALLTPSGIQDWQVTPASSSGISLWVIGGVVLVALLIGMSR